MEYFKGKTAVLYKNKYQFGTEFIVTGRIRGRIIDFRPVDERICILRMKGRFHKYSLLCAHAPTEGKEAYEKDDFYDNLDNFYDERPKFDIKIHLGDFNAKVGKRRMQKPSTGPNSLHADSNGNRECLINFAVSQRMIIGRTMFQHKNIHKATWKSPDGNILNQTDHVLIDS
jgi:hypothetical protein